MKFLPWIVATVALASLTPTPAPAASGGPVSLVYRISGLRDDGSAAFAGVASAVTCTLYSGVNEDLVVAVRNFLGNLVTAQTYSNLVPFRTFTVVTHSQSTFASDAVLPSAGTIIDQGTFAIASTTTAISCTAEILNAATLYPLGWDLHGTRYNPDPGSQE